MAAPGELWSNIVVLFGGTRTASMITGAFALGLAGLGFGMGVGEPEARAHGPVPGNRPLVGLMHAPSVSTRGGSGAREVGAVVEVKLPDRMAANTPMEEHVAVDELARAWHAVLGKHASESTLSVLWAHWAHETGRGQRMHAHNFAGIKGRGPSGASVVVWTREGPGSTDLVQRTFRAYRNPAEGARDYVRLLATRYPPALRAAREGNAYGFASALASGGYFTGDDRAYLRALTSLSLECRRRGLTKTAGARK